MKNNILIILTFITSACGAINPNVTANTHSGLSIESKYVPYFKAFANRAASVGSNVKVNNLTIRSVSSISDPGVVALCQQEPGQSPLIIVSQEWWPQFDVTMREDMIFHEMGHCVLNRGHRSDENNKLSLSIMNPYIFGGLAYLGNYDHYMHELFFQTDLPSELPLVFLNADPTYVASIKTLLSNYSNTQSSKIMDSSAPEKTTLSQETLSHLGCGQE